jgi:hypothetical protein
MQRMPVIMPLPAALQALQLTHAVGCYHHWGIMSVS